MGENKDELIARLVNARKELDTALQIVAPEMEIYPSWKLKQLLDHITGWDELVAATFRSHASGEEPSLQVKDGIHHYNNLSIEYRKSLSLGESRQAYDNARDKVLQSLREMPDSKLDEKFKAPWGGMCTVANAVGIFSAHELEHVKQVDAALKKTPKHA